MVYSAPNALQLEDSILIECPHCSATLVICRLEVRVAVEKSPVAITLEPAPALDDGLDAVVSHVEAELVELALREAGGVKARAAALLGLKYSTFWDLTDRLGVELEEDRPREVTSLDEADVVNVRVPLPDRDPLRLELPVDRDEGLLASVVDGCRRNLARWALERTHGNLSRAAERLEMKYTTFHSLARRLSPTTGAANGATGGPGSS